MLDCVAESDCGASGERGLYFFSVDNVRAA
jgi:hypothetical protein